MDRRDEIIKAIPFIALLTVALTEALSYFYLLARGPAIIAWVLIAAILFLVARRLRPHESSRADYPERLSRLNFRERALRPEPIALVTILAVTLVLGMLTPPKHPDATTYHLPRVLHWIQNASLRPYPTNIDRQLWIGAGHEYFLVNLRLIAGTDRIAPLIQWLSFVGIIPLVTVIARELGALRRGQWFAALFAVTLPIAITQATGVQVDIFASFWLCVTVALLLRVRRTGGDAATWVDAVAIGSAAGMAILAKAVNVLYLVPFVVWILIALFRRARPRRVFGLVALAMLPMFAINVPQVQRNISVWNNPLGVPDEYGVANEIITPASITSNVIRNLVTHANSRFDGWNRLVYDGVVAAHSGLGLDHNDSRTTYGNRPYEVPRKVEDEGVSTNRYHLLIILAAIFLAWKKKIRAAFLFLGCVVIGALVFSTYLKWQLWHTRLHMPLFIVSAGAVAVVLEKTISEPKLRFLGWFLLLFAVPPLFRNGFAPVISRHPVFTVPYEGRLFLDPRQREALPKVADLIAGSGCARVGLVWERALAEYPVWNLMRARTRGDVEIRHVFVTNETRRMTSERDRLFKPCAIISAPRQLYRMVIPPAGFNPVLTANGYTVWLLAKT